MWPAEDKENESAPAFRITVSTRPRLSLPCPRMSSTATVKDAAHLASARQTCQWNNPGEHANMSRASSKALPQRCCLAALARSPHPRGTDRALAAQVDSMQATVLGNSRLMTTEEGVTLFGASVADTHTSRLESRRAFAEPGVRRDSGEDAGSR